MQTQNIDEITTVSGPYIDGDGGGSGFTPPWLNPLQAFGSAVSAIGAVSMVAGLVWTAVTIIKKRMKNKKKADIESQGEIKTIWMQDVISQAEERPESALHLSACPPVNHSQPNGALTREKTRRNREKSQVPGNREKSQSSLAPAPSGQTNITPEKKTKTIPENQPVINNTANNDETSDKSNGKETNRGRKLLYKRRTDSNITLTANDDETNAKNIDKEHSKGKKLLPLKKAGTENTQIDTPEDDVIGDPFDISNKEKPKRLAVLDDQLNPKNNSDKIEMSWTNGKSRNTSATKDEKPKTEKGTIQSKPVTTKLVNADRLDVKETNNSLTDTTLNAVQNEAKHKIKAKKTAGDEPLRNRSELTMPLDTIPKSKTKKSGISNTTDEPVDFNPKFENVANQSKMVTTKQPEQVKDMKSDQKSPLKKNNKNPLTDTAINPLQNEPTQYIKSKKTGTAIDKEPAQKNSPKNISINPPADKTIPKSKSKKTGLTTTNEELLHLNPISKVKGNTMRSDLTVQHIADKENSPKFNKPPLDTSLQSKDDSVTESKSKKPLVVSDEILDLNLHSSMFDGGNNKRSDLNIIDDPLDVDGELVVDSWNLNYKPKSRKKGIVNESVHVNAKSKLDTKGIQNMKTASHHPLDLDGNTQYPKKKKDLKCNDALEMEANMNNSESHKIRTKKSINSDDASQVSARSTNWEKLNLKRSDFQITEHPLDIDAGVKVDTWNNYKSQSKKKEIFDEPIHVNAKSRLDTNGSVHSKPTSHFEIMDQPFEVDGQIKVDTWNMNYKTKSKKKEIFNEPYHVDATSRLNTNGSVHSKPSSQFEIMDQPLEVDGKIKVDTWNTNYKTKSKKKDIFNEPIHVNAKSKLDTKGSLHPKPSSQFELLDQPLEVNGKIKVDTWNMNYKSKSKKKTIFNEPYHVNAKSKLERNGEHNRVTSEFEIPDHSFDVDGKVKVDTWNMNYKSKSKKKAIFNETFHMHARSKLDTHSEMNKKGASAHTTIDQPLDMDASINVDTWNMHSPKLKGKVNQERPEIGMYTPPLKKKVVSNEKSNVTKQSESTFTKEMQDLQWPKPTHSLETHKDIGSQDRTSHSKKIKSEARLHIDEETGSLLTPRRYRKKSKGGIKVGSITPDVTPRGRFRRPSQPTIPGHIQVLASYELSQEEETRSKRFRKKSLSFLKPTPWSRNRVKSDSFETALDDRHTTDKNTTGRHSNSSLGFINEDVEDAGNYNDKSRLRNVKSSLGFADCIDTQEVTKKKKRKPSLAFLRKEKPEVEAKRNQGNVPSEAWNGVGLKKSGMEWDNDKNVKRFTAETNF